jgi:hypothetical protein
MADADIRKLVEKLRSLSPAELGALQTQVDTLEARGRSSHHETTSHHHTSALAELPAIKGLE